MMPLLNRATRWWSTPRVVNKIDRALDWAIVYGVFVIAALLLAIGLTLLTLGGAL